MTSHPRREVTNFFAWHCRLFRSMTSATSKASFDHSLHQTNPSKTERWPLPREPTVQAATILPSLPRQQLQRTLLLLPMPYLNIPIKRSTQKIRHKTCRKFKTPVRQKCSSRCNHYLSALLLLSAKILPPLCRHQFRLLRFRLVQNFIMAIT